ncbi:hypothetical protein BCR32DRAFT_247526 [Anaeromyces robustus]|uniref:GH18 domain-containing protein n=1 Tax=Anaeromyces robustus TaxID=1754192 RepID=A0A1Y1WXY5_9FUNG|nr:hypothetical protein BCR32DRAFT_247526 [Anaeromyces robustus]|eukprot:ORX77964.1 hypothetical protein BCR32DRAFT_247526 [Anaeromyces robustus]
MKLRNLFLFIPFTFVFSTTHIVRYNENKSIIENNSDNAFLSTEENNNIYINEIRNDSEFLPNEENGYWYNNRQIKNLKYNYDDRNIKYLENNQDTYSYKNDDKNNYKQKDKYNNYNIKYLENNQDTYSYKKDDKNNYKQKGKYNNYKTKYYNRYNNKNKNKNKYNNKNENKTNNNMNQLENEYKGEYYTENMNESMNDQIINNYNNTLFIDDSINEDSINEDSIINNTSTTKSNSKKIFSPYVDIMQYPTFDLKNIKDTLNINTFIISFIVCCDSPSCSMNSASFGGSIDIGENNDNNENSSSYYSADRIDSVIYDFQKSGGNIIISFGGADNKELALCHDDPYSLAKEYKKVIQKYHPQRLDFDIEGYYGGENVHKLRAQALKILKTELQDEMPLISLCLSVNPDIGFDSATLSIIESMKNEDIPIDLISIMTMDYGSSYANTYSYINALKSLEASYQQSKMYYPKIKMGLIPMIGENDDGSVFSLYDAEKLIENIKEKDYVHMVSMWSINRDKNNGDFNSLTTNTFQNPKYETKCGGKTKYLYSTILKKFIEE